MVFFLQPSPKYLVYPVVLRVLFIPFFLSCNYQPQVGREIPVLITSDWGYWIGAALMAITSGYFSSVAMMYCPRYGQLQLSVAKIVQ